MTDTAITPRLRETIERAVRDNLERFGAIEVEVTEDRDHEGGPSILVYVHWRDADVAPEPKALSDTVFQINMELVRLKEGRFAYLLHRMPTPEPSHRKVAAR